MKKKTSPTQRSLAVLKERGYLCDVVEKWNPYARVRNDLFGFIDILAIKDGEVLGVQTTTSSNMAARITKIAEHENVGAVRSAGIRIHVHGWKKTKDGWVCREEDVS